MYVSNASMAMEHSHLVAQKAQSVEFGADQDPEVVLFFHITSEIRRVHAHAMMGGYPNTHAVHDGNDERRNGYPIVYPEPTYHIQSSIRSKSDEDCSKNGEEDSHGLNRRSAGLDVSGC